MKHFSLNGAWTLDIPGTEFTRVPATVPGSVYHDLLAGGRIPDPFYRDNENEALKLMDNSFDYTRSFACPAELLDCDAVLLRCEGLDTLATITLNDQVIGKTDNMHRIWEFNVRTLLRDDLNTIHIHFDSPTLYIKEAYEKDPADGSSDAMVGFPLIRKAHCMYGWDWGPRLPDAGIWRDISLIGIEKARIQDVRTEQIHENGSVTVKVFTNVRLLGSGFTSAKTEITITAPDGKTFTAVALGGDFSEALAARPVGKFSCSVKIDDPQLWWPNGFGEQPLYTVRVDLIAEGKHADFWERRIGLRTMTIHREKDQYGEGFCHRVNGVDIFAMGADYIPEDNLLPRVNPERTRRLLEDAKAANMNCIRVWGGGYYPDDYFYDICDELGLMVWQDFMFACAVYNLTEVFDKNIRAEIVDNVRRLRHHASLGLWCGNNEMEQFVSFGTWVLNDRQKADYIKMYEYIFPEILKVEDPSTFYWPASPSSGGSFDDPVDPNRGDVHYWEVWHGLKPFTDYRNFYFRYASEFGFQSFPSMETIESFTLPEDRNVFSYVMEKHQRNASANGKIASYLSAMYLYPATLDGFVYASQLLQAQAMQYGVEHWRRNRGRCMGAVVWQLNDCWPVVSWASIDYYGRWKALHYYEKRFFAPVLISCHEEGILSQDTNVNAEPYDLKKTARLNVSNETREDFDGIVRWSLRRPDASIIEEGSETVHVPALTALWLEEHNYHDEDTYAAYFSYSLETPEGEMVGSGSVLFCPPKHFRFIDPSLRTSVETDLSGDTFITVTAEAYARSVEIQCGADVVLEDNFFDMDGGSKRIRVLRGTPENVSARSVYDIR